MHRGLTLSHDKVAAQCSRKDLRLVKDIEGQSFEVLVGAKSSYVLYGVKESREARKRKPCLDRPTCEMEESKAVIVRGR